MIHYYELCGGREVRVPMPPIVSARKQRQRVSACITKQVRVNAIFLSPRYQLCHDIQITFM